MTEGMTMATKAQVLKAAQAKHGKRAFLRENPKALDAAGKEAHREESLRRVAENKAAAEERKAIGLPWNGLLAAASFVCDVGGDEPSIPQLREAVAKAKRYQELTDILNDFTEWSRKTGGALFHSRCEVCENLGIAYTTLCGGDTWDECMEKLKTAVAV